MSETTTIVLPQDRLELHLIAKGKGLPLPMLMFTKDVTIDVTFCYQAAQAGRYDGPPEDCYPSEPAWVEVSKVVLAEDATLWDGEEDDKCVRLLLKKGHDLDYLPKDVIDWIEDYLKEEVEAACH